MHNYLYKEKYKKIFSLLENHNDLFSNSIPLIASENITSPAVREATISDFANRYAEGWPGERVYAGCEYIDQVELECAKLAKELYNAEFADVRPISGVVSNLIIYSAFTLPGDIMMCMPISSGGHISHGKKEYNGTAGLVHGLDIDSFPFDKVNMNIDIDKTIHKIKKLEQDKIPKLSMFGGSLFLFPHPVKELSEVFKEYNIHINYDAAHVAGLIAGKQFQDPLREGADTMTMSTHKTLFGPQGGLILSYDKFAEKIKKATFPGLTSNHHIHHMAAKTIAFIEALEFGSRYAKDIIENAKMLACSLSEFGFDVLGEKNGFTKSHQVVVDISKYSDGGKAEKELEKSNIIINRQLIPGDIKAGRNYLHPGGIRIGVSEITRLGMKKSEMKQIAEFIKNVIIDKKESVKIQKKVKMFRNDFQKVKYCFDDKTKAYEYIKIK